MSPTSNPRFSDEKRGAATRLIGRAGLVSAGLGDRIGQCLERHIHGPLRPLTIDLHRLSRSDRRLLDEVAEVARAMHGLAGERGHDVSLFQAGGRGGSVRQDIRDEHAGPATHAEFGGQIGE